MKFIKNCILCIVIGVAVPKINSQTVTEGFETDAIGWHQYLVEGSIPFYLITDDYNSGEHSAYTYTEKVGGLISYLQNESWLISPPMDFSNAGRIDLSYFQRNIEIHSGGSSDPTQQIVYSTDYSGAGDPYNATWYILYDSPTSVNWTQNTIEDSNLPKVDNLTIAFRYVGKSERLTLLTRTSKAWLIDDVVIQGYTCAATTVWENGIWSNGTPTSNTLAIIRQNYDTDLHGSFEACSLEIDNGINTNISDNTYITIHRNFTNNGTLTITNKGSLLMTDDEAIIDGSGTTTVYKTSNPLKLYDYNYWSSPVTNATIGNALSTSPLEHIYYYNPTNHDGTNDSGWQNVNSNNIMTPGTGYIALAPTTGTFPQTQTVSFTGQVNNGIITQTVDTNNTDVDWNLLGNPYPSAIDIDLFVNYEANTSVDKTVYLWTHNTNWINNPSGTSYTTDDYAVYTSGIGGTAAISGGKKATQFISSGQSFFINANTEGIVSYTNAMRTNIHNDTFYRNQSTKNKSENEIDRIWLNITNNEGAFSQMLVGFTEKATDLIDSFDGPSFGSGYLSLYSIIEGKAYTINGRSPLNGNTEIPLGFTSYLNKGTTAKIAIDARNGTLATSLYDILLYDKTLNIQFDLSQGAYEFELDEPGSYNERFTLFLHTTKTNQTPPNLTKDTLIIDQKNSQLNLKTKLNNIIKLVQVYDLKGQLLLREENNSSALIINNHSFANGSILIVQATLEDNSKLTKKIILIK
ncbi:hypothetical protein MWU59_01010 [Flavobacteriaceae bacterium F08102]|nr:hypothetical protein [Flavobacteriaceae bacterium F08102]